MKNLALFLAFFFSLSSYAGDIITLTNQLKFEGKVTKIKGCFVSFKSEGSKYVIPATEIFSIQFENVRDKVYTKYLESLEMDPNKCMLGQLDAENYHGKKGGHFALGFLFGPFAMIGTAIANPTPEKGNKTYMMSENKDLFNDLEYISCYKKKAKGKLIAMEAAGWGSFILLYLLFGGG